MSWWTTKAWPWLRKNWKWVLLPIGVGLFLLQVFGRRKVEVVSSELTGAAETKRLADAEAQRKELEAERERDQALEEARSDHAEEVGELIEEQESQVDDLVDDPDALNEHLLDVGKKVRRGR